MSLWDRLRIWAAGGEVEKIDDPDFLLTQAQRELMEVHARNRERAVHAITQKNNLEAAVQEAQRRRDNARLRANTADERGEAREAELCRLEAEEYERTHAELTVALEIAVGEAETVKADIRREEERIRRKTAEALALRAQWKAAQVQRSLLASLVEVNAGLEQQVPPEALRERHARNRRLVAQAIVQRDNLQVMLDDTQKRVEMLREKAGLAGSRGDDEMERQLLREMEQYEATLAGTRDALTRAEEVTEKAVALIQQEEARLREVGMEVPEITAATREAEEVILSEDALEETPKPAREIPDWAIPVMLAFALLVLALLIALLG